MNYKVIEERIAAEVENKLKLYGFIINNKDLEKEHFVKFSFEKEKAHFVFGFSFLHYKKTLAIEPYINVSFDEISEIVKKNTSWESDYYNNWLAISSRIGNLLNVKNKDGFFNNNNTLQIEVVLSEDGIKKAISTLIGKYFLKGALAFIESTKSLEDIDKLINSWVIRSEPPLKRLACFGSNRPWQITTGIIVAKLVNRPDYDQLLERYVGFANSLEDDDNEWIKNFYSIVEYLKKI